MGTCCTKTNSEVAYPIFFTYSSKDKDVSKLLNLWSHDSLPLKMEDAPSLEQKTAVLKNDNKKQTNYDTTEDLATHLLTDDNVYDETEEVYFLYIEKWGYPPKQARHLLKFAKSINTKLTWKKASELIKNPPNRSEPKNTSEIVELVSTVQSSKSTTNTYTSPSTSTTFPDTNAGVPPHKSKFLTVNIQQTSSSCWAVAVARTWLDRAVKQNLIDDSKYNDQQITKIIDGVVTYWVNQILYNNKLCGTLEDGGYRKRLLRALGDAYFAENRKQFRCIMFDNHDSLVEVLKRGLRVTTGLLLPLDLEIQNQQKQIFDERGCIDVSQINWKGNNGAHALVLEDYDEHKDEYVLRNSWGDIIPIIRVHANSVLGTYVMHRSLLLLHHPQYLSKLQWKDWIDQALTFSGDEIMNSKIIVGGDLDFRAQTKENESIMYLSDDRDFER